MARLFTTSFLFQEKFYTVVVSITECQGQHTVMLYLPDASLHHLLPDGRLSFRSQEELRLDFPTLTPAQELLIAVFAAIEEYQAANPLPVQINQRLWNS